jgi:hypothetical protein
MPGAEADLLPRREADFRAGGDSAESKAGQRVMEQAVSCPGVFLLDEYRASRQPG